MTTAPPPDSQHDVTPSGTSVQSSHSEKRPSKIPDIAAACRAQDIPALVALAKSPDGLVSDAARRQAWPLLLGCSAGASDPPSNAERCEPLPPHRDEAQVRLDVDRSFVYYPKGEGTNQLGQRREQLQHLIVHCLRRFPFLSYFQGYHDIVQVLLLVLGPDHAASAVDRLSLLRIRDFMLPSLSAAVEHLKLLPCILRAADLELERHVAVTQPFFALAATLTLYAHEIEEYADIARLFDFLLATEASMSIYLFAVTILSRRDELLQVDQSEPEMMHAILSKLPKPLDLEKLLARAQQLFESHPPYQLPNRSWQYVDPDSVLKTTQGPERLAKQTLDDGRRCFENQARRLRRRQLMQRAGASMWAYRRPMASVGLAVAVALLSWMLQSRGLGTASALEAVMRQAARLWSR